MNLQAKRSVFRSRKGDDGVGIGKPLACGKHMKVGPKFRTVVRRTWWQRLQDRARQKLLSSSDGSAKR